MRNLGGDLSVESVYGEGATFLCLIPIPPEDVIREAQRYVSPSSPAPAAGPAQTVLIVDADTQMLRSYARVLGPDHRLLTAHDEHEAIEQLSTGTAPDTLVVDFDLPGRGGAALVAWLDAHRPTLAARTVLVTSSDAELRHGDVLRRHEGPIIQKPLRGEMLLRVLLEL
jgi:CheY-like chemotaxis protein